jgi:hypothetical protein
MSSGNVELSITDENGEVYSYDYTGDLSETYDDWADPAWGIWDWIEDYYDWVDENETYE